jgi:murein lipoprotein
MSKVLLALTSAALLALSGCAEVQTKPADKPAAATPAAAKPAEAKPAISAEAQAALATAQADVKTAMAKNALWTTAEDALEAAEAAAAKGDSATVLSQSRLASDHVKKGLAQLNYPMLKIGD